MLTTHYYIYCVYARDNKKVIYKEVKEFNRYLKIKDFELYNRMNEIGQIKYNRKTKFVFVRISPKMFSSFLNTCGKFFR